MRALTPTSREGYGCLAPTIVMCPLLPETLSSLNVNVTEPPRTSLTWQLNVFPAFASMSLGQLIDFAGPAFDAASPLRTRLTSLL